MYKKISACVITTSILCGNCQVIAGQQPAGSQDPFKFFNKAMYAFNDGLDHLILKPVAKAYLKVTPQPVVTGVDNFYNNLSNLPTIGNDVLQADFHQAVADTSRLLINSTLGLAGVLDVAKLAGLPQNSEDMGLTFAHWGWTSSTYVVLPFFGPSTVRDTLGKPIDNEMSAYKFIHNVRLRNSLYALGVVNTRADLLQLQDVIAEAALDPYVFQRNAYLQRRNYLINRNEQLEDVHGKTATIAINTGYALDEIPPVTAKQVANY